MGSALDAPTSRLASRLADGWDGRRTTRFSAVCSAVAEDQKINSPAGEEMDEPRPLAQTAVGSVMEGTGAPPRSDGALCGGGGSRGAVHTASGPTPPDCRRPSN
jgi:hypothetical protein